MNNSPHPNAPATASYFKAERAFVHARSAFERARDRSRANPTKKNLRRSERRLRKMNNAWARVRRERDAYAKLRGVAA